MSCLLEKMKNEIASEINNITGENKVLYQTIINEVFTGTQYSDKFIAFCDANNVNVNELDDAKEIAKYAKRFHYNYNASVYYALDTTVQDTTIALGYESIDDREEGKRHATYYLLRKYNIDFNTGVVNSNPRAYYLNELINIFTKALHKDVAERKLVDNIKEYQQEFLKLDKSSKSLHDKLINRIKFFEEKLKNKETLKTNSLLAVLKDIASSPLQDNKYLDELLNNPVLSGIKRQIDKEKNKTKKQETTNKNVDVQTDKDNSKGNEEDDMFDDEDGGDAMIAAANSHMGTYTTFMAHIGERLKNYFNGLTKLNTALTTTKEEKRGDIVKKVTVYDENTNNRYGMPETMDANSCSTVLYGESYRFTSVEEMIKAIEDIAYTRKEFAAFKKFADDLRNNYDFAFEVFTTFAKTPIRKVQMITQNGKSFVRNSNTRAARREAFFANTTNALRNALLDSDKDVIGEQIKEVSLSIEILKNKINTLNDKYTTDARKEQIKEEIKIARNDIAKQLVHISKLYFPNIEEGAVLTFLNRYANANDTNSGFYENCVRLENVLSKTNEESSKTVENWYNKRLITDKIRAKNEALQRAIDSKTFVDYSDYSQSDEDDVNYDYFTKGQYSALISMTEYMLDFSTVQLQLNSPNVYGNNSSDVINNSYITNIVKIIQNTRKNSSGQMYNPMLEAWGKQKLKDKSNKYNSILLRQKREDDTIITDGIFEEVDGRLIITENAIHLLDLALFDGASFIDNGNNMTYNKMQEGDFLPTAYMAYFNTKTPLGYKKGVTNGVARYFLRTPSDAPKTFTVQSAKYDTETLFVDKVAGASDAVVNEILDDLHNYKQLTVQQYKELYPNRPHGTTLTSKEFDKLIACILGTDSMYIPNSDNDKVTELEDGYAIRSYATPKGNRIIIKGKLEQRGNARRMTGLTIEAMVSEYGTESIPTQIVSSVTDYAKDRIRKGDVHIFGKTYEKPEQTIDTTHPVFAIIKNQFKKELLDCAIAIDHYFETDDLGFVSTSLDDQNNIVIKTKTEELNTTGYERYHLDSSGKVLNKDENGEYVLNGGVFHSNKFTLSIQVTNENGETVVAKKNYLDELITTKQEDDDKGMINLLYGGSSGNYLHVKKVNGVVEDVVLTREQDAAVNEAINNFLVEYVKQVDTKVKQYRRFIRGTGTSSKQTTDFAINNLIMLMNYDDLFEGNTKFYKNTQDLLKRAKEYQGSGIPYAAIDYNSVDDYDMTPLEKCMLNTGSWNGEKIQDIIKTGLGNNVYLRKGFYGVTVNNSTSTNIDRLNALRKQLVSIFEKEGFNKKVANEKAMDILYGPIQYNENGEPKKDKNNKPIRKGGFTETTVNDAQSYITIDEWIRRIAARGQLVKYMPLIKKLLDPNSNLTASDLTEFVQVQKNFYYDMVYDEKYGKNVPRQIKNAEFVLIPRLIKGTQLEEVYNLMKSAGIDQLNTKETSKAANETVLTLWDNDGNLVGKDTFIQEALAHKQTYSYKYLYTQQETPQHMDAENKAGIQIVKKVLDNISENSPLYKHKIRFMKNMIANIRQSYIRLLDELEIPRDSNGRIITNIDGKIDNINLKVFYDKFKTEMIRLGADSNLIDYVTLDENGQPKMPALSNLVLSRFENILQSMFNRAITRQMLPGFHAAQITNVGWRKFVEGDVIVSYATDLEYHPDQYVSEDGKYISKRYYNLLDKEERKKYKKAGPAPYIEVMLPLSTFGIDRNSKYYKNKSDAEILKELEDKGLDKVIGYRIPTEGKQSICIMKVAGFVSDAYGSTIVVPNDWVSQTGSDFDIDSVYGIQYEYYKDNSGEIHKVKNIDGNTNEVTIKDWFRYIKNKANEGVHKDANKEVKEKIAKVNTALNDVFNDIELSGAFYNALPDDAKRIMRQVDSILKNDEQFKKLNAREQRRDRIINKYNYCVDLIEKFTNKKDKQAIYNYAKSLNKLREFYSTDTSDDLSIYEEALTKNKGVLEDCARELGIKSYEEFLDSAIHRPEEINSTAARNNVMLDSMLTILTSPESLEENLSRSNFDDIIYWRNQIMNVNQSNARKFRSGYNILDQISYQEDATSGLALKGMSVMMDTMCSVCNTVRPVLASPINIVYDESDYVESSDKIIKRFTHKNKKGKEIGAKKVSKDGKKKIFVAHRKYGWSEDNRNISGKLITAYSSQTTAHILDAIKEGNIPGVNIYTFMAYKTLVNSGSDYKAAIGFIMQPGIKRLIDNNAANTSVYADRYSDPIKQTIKDIAKELGIACDYRTPIKKVIEELQFRYDDVFNELFKVDSSEEDLTISLVPGANARIPLIVSDLIDRIKERGKFKVTTPVEGMSEEELQEIEKQRVRRLVFDLGSVLIFKHINNIATQVSSAARCLNPDKFGAKQTVFSTNDVFHTILTKIYNYEHPLADGGYARKVPMLTVTNESGEEINILEAVYNNVEEGTLSNPAKGILSGYDYYSKYGTLHAFLKYASATSITIARTILPTQSPNFVAAIRSFEKNIMSGIVPHLDEATYSDLQKYVLSYFYNTIPQLNHPLIYDYDNKAIIEVNDGSADVIGTSVETNPESFEDFKEEAKRLNEQASTLKEIQRLYGFGYAPKLSIAEEQIKDGKKELVFKDFSVADINNPTKTEVEDYMKLTPAQKVYFIQKNFNVPGIFGMFDASLYNEKNRGYKEGMQTIEFSENNASTEVIYSEFNKMFNSTNPLIKLAAVDIIKYGILVEGYRMASRSINKVIDNDILLQPLGNHGMGIVTKLIDKTSTFGKSNDINDVAQLNEIFERYLRSHRSSKAIKTIFLNARTSANLGLHIGTNGMVYTKPNPPKDNEIIEKDGETIEINNSEEAMLADWNSRLVQAGIKEYNDYSDTFKTNRYVFISVDNKSHLYRIKEVRDGIILYPLSDLEQFETTPFSVKQSNNEQCPLKQAFEYIIASYNKNTEAIFTSEYVTSLKDQLELYGVLNDYNVVINNNSSNLIPAKDFNLEELAKTSDGAARALDSIKRAFANDITPKRHWFTNLELTHYIFTPSLEASLGSEQNITIGENNQIKVIINRQDDSALRKYLKKDKKNKEYFAISDAALEEDFKHTGYDVRKDLENDELKKIAKTARKNNRKQIDTLFVATLVESQNESYHATAEELNYDFLDYVKSQASREDVSAIEMLNTLKSDNINEENIKNTDNTATFIKRVSKLANAKADELYDLVYHFEENPNEPKTYFAITDDIIQEMLKGNRPLVEKYTRVVNEIKAALTKLEGYYSLDISSDDPETNYFLTEIKEAVKKIKSLPIDKINSQFINGHIANLSTNPIIKDELITAYEGFFGTSGIAWMFNDIGEVANPLAQIILNDVNSNIESSRLMTKRVIDTFRKRVADIEKRAREKGKTVDRNKIIRNGRIVRNYSQEFEDKLEELVTNVDNAVEIHGTGSYEHLVAKNELDEFTAKYCNQEAKPQYYRNMAAADKRMLEAHKDIFLKYMRLFYEMMDYRNLQSDAGINEDIRQKIEEKRKEISALTSTRGHFDEDGNWIQKTEEEQTEVLALAKYIEYRRQQSKKYFDYDSVYGFDDLLKKNLNIVESFEKRNPITGLPTVPQDVLEQHEEYRIAKNWLRDNAAFVLREYDEDLPEDSISKKLNNALRRLSLVGNGKIKGITTMFKDKLKYDRHGVMDPRNLTEEEIAKIKEKQETYYQINSSVPTNSDRQVISSAKGTTEIYKKGFYDKLSGGRKKSSEYLAAVSELNRHLEKIYDENDRIIHFDWIPDTTEGIAELETIARLIHKVRKAAKYEIQDDIELASNKDIALFIKTEVDVIPNYTAYEAQKQAAIYKSQEYLVAWQKCNLEYNKDGEPQYVWHKDAEGKWHKGKRKINSILYCHFEAKNKEKWLDVQKTEDSQLVNKYYRKVPTIYYNRAVQEALEKDEHNPGYYKKWYDANHVYNPFTRTFEPLQIWMKSELREELFGDDTKEGKWVPKNNQRERKVKDGMKTVVAPDGSIETYRDDMEDMRNHDYKENVGVAENYHKGADNGKYDNDVELNEFEIEMRDYLLQVLMNTANNNRLAKKYFEKGYIPKRAKYEESILKQVLTETGKLFGVSASINKEAKDWEAQIGYDTDFNRLPPMLGMLQSEKEGSKKFEEPKPKRRDYATEEEYDKAYIDWKRRKDEVYKHNREIEQKLMDKDYFGVIEEYLERVGRHNSIQNNVQKLYWLHNMLKDQKVYAVEYNLWGDTNLEVNDRKSNETYKDYQTKVDENLVKQYETFLRRLILDQWKEKSNVRTTIGNHLQNFTSGVYMMLNIKGGISNVTLGKTGMLAEAVAGEYFNYRQLVAGQIEWNKGFLGFARGLYNDNDKPGGLQDGIAKLFKVVDYDEWRGVSTEIKLEKYAERVRNAMFSPQTIGEHFMQNSVLFAMLKSHKIVDFPDDARGIGKVYMNKKEYIRYKESLALNDMLTEEQQQKFKAFKEKIKDDEQEKAKYALFRRDLVSEFTYIHLTDEELEKFDKIREQRKKEWEEEFDAKADMYSQLELKENGEIGFKYGSDLEALDRMIDTTRELTEEEKADAKYQNLNNMTKAMTLVGMFSERVRKVNTKIHGAYNRFGRAWIEGKWYGSLIMQYHKHLPIGILKRYRTRGYWNEARGTAEKGFITAFRDFMSLNARKIKAKAGLTEANVQAVEGLQNIFKMSFDFLTQLSATWNHIPEYDRATIKRNVGDLVGVLSGVLFVIGLHLAWDDDDEAKEGIPFNLALYEADRLASEAFLYNPIGLWTETKTLMSTPVAAQSIISDAVNSIGLISAYILEGDDFDGTYKSGKYYGESKLKVYIERRIPMWNGIRGVLDIAKNNRAYKRGTKPTSVASTILKWTQDD